MSVWSIEFKGGGGDASLATYKITSATMEFQSQGSDILTFEAVMPYEEATEIFNYRREVILRRSGAVFFRGWIYSPARVATSDAERMVVEVGGPWYWLEQKEFRQSRASGFDELDGARGLEIMNGTAPGMEGPGGIFFNADDHGDAITITDHLTQIIGQAGNLVQLGSLPPGFRTMPYKASGSVAGVLREALKWQKGGVITVLDYSTEPPTLNIGVRAGLGVLELPLGGAPVSGIQIKARYDLRVDCVKVITNLPGQFDPDTHESGLQITEYRAEGATPLPGVPERCITIQNFGTQARDPEPTTVDVEYIYQGIKTRTIPKDGATNLKAKEWWSEKLPNLRSMVALNFNLNRLGMSKIPIHDVNERPEVHVEPHNVIFADDAGAAPPAINPRAVPVAGAGPEDYPRELIEGQIAEWMQRKTTPLLVTATLMISERTVQAIKNPKLKALAELTFRYRQKVNGVWHRSSDVAAHVTGTNARTKLYRAPVRVTVTEQDGVEQARKKNISEELAAALANAMNWVPYEGSWTFHEEEAGAVRWLGSVVNLPGTPVTEWDTMRTPVQTESLDLYSGVTSVTFGPPSQVDITQDATSQAELPESTTTTFEYYYGTGRGNDAEGGIKIPQGFEQPRNNADVASEIVTDPQAHSGGPRWVKRTEEGDAIVDIGPVYLTEYTNDAAPIRHVPEWIGDETKNMDDNEPFRMTLTPGKWYLVCKWSTNQKGRVGKGITVYPTQTAPPEGKYPWPPSPECNGRDGEFETIVGIYEVDEDPGKPILYRSAHAPVTWMGRQWEGVNKGSGARPYICFKGERDEFWFRNTKGSYGAEDIRCKVEVKEEGNDMVIYAWSKKTGGDYPLPNFYPGGGSSTTYHAICWDPTTGMVEWADITDELSGS